MEEKQTPLLHWNAEDECAEGMDQMQELLEAIQQHIKVQT